MDTMTLMLLRIIQNNPRSLSIKELVPITGLTEKKLRTTLAEVRTFVKSEKGSLVFSQGVYHLEPTNIDFVSKVYTMSFYDYKLSKYERIIVEFFLCLLARPIITIAEISDLLFVSRSTVNADLKELEEILSNQKIDLVGLTGNGIYIEGTTECIDKVVYQFLTSNPYLLEMLLSQDESSMSFKELRTFNKIAKEAIRETENELKHFLSEKESQALNSFLTYKFGVHTDQRLVHTELKLTPFFHKLLDRLGGDSEVFYSRELTAYDATFRPSSAMFDSNTDDMIIQFMVMSFIENVTQKIGLPLSADFDFYQNLSRHIQSVYINKPILPENVAALMLIKEEYPEIMDIVEEEVVVFEHLFKRTLSDVEKSLILIYVCTSVEKFYHECQRLNILIVCNAGVGIGRLMQAKLEARFRFNVVGCIAKKQLASFSKEQYDFIISTVPLRGFPFYVLVSYLLSNEDIALINQMMSKTYLSQHLKTQDKESLSDFTLEKHPKISMSEVMTTSRILLDIEAITWEEAIKKASQPLLDENVIENSYIHAMIDNVKENGMYMVIGPSTILPHAELNRGSLKLGISFARLKNEIKSDSLSIKFIFVLSPINQTSHLDLIFHLGRLAKSKKFLTELTAAQTAEEVIQLLEERSEEDDRLFR